MAVVTITNENFEDEVLAAKVPVILDFWAEWCGPCKMQSPVFEALSEELAGKVKFGSVNVDEQAALSPMPVMNNGLWKMASTAIWPSPSAPHN